MNKFETNVCPLCNTVLKMRKVSGVAVFECPSISVNGHSHYEVEQDTKTAIQHIYLGPWSIDTFGDSNKSRIYKQGARADGSRRWILVKEVPMIRATAHEQMLERINTLMTFL